MNKIELDFSCRKEIMYNLPLTAKALTFSRPSDGKIDSVIRRYSRIEERFYLPTPFAFFITEAMLRLR